MTKCLTKNSFRKISLRKLAATVVIAVGSYVASADACLMALVRHDYQLVYCVPSACSLYCSKRWHCFRYLMLEPLLFRAQAPCRYWVVFQMTAISRSSYFRLAGLRARIMVYADTVHPQSEAGLMGSSNTPSAGSICSCRHHSRTRGLVA